MCSTVCSRQDDLSVFPFQFLAVSALGVWRDERSFFFPFYSSYLYSRANSGPSWLALNGDRTVS